MTISNQFEAASGAARRSIPDLRWTTRLWLGLTLILVVAILGSLPFQFELPDAWILPGVIFGIMVAPVLLTLLAGMRFLSTLLTALIAPTILAGGAWMSHRVRPWAASPVSAMAAPRPELVQSFVVRETGPMRSSGRRSTAYVTYAIAPVVETGWRPGDPVAAWVLASEHDIAPGHRTPRTWSEPGAFLPFTPRAMTITRRAEDTPPQLGPPTVDPPVMGAWVRDLGAVQHRMVLRMVLLTGGGMLLFTLAVLLSRRGPGSPNAPGTATQAGGDVVR